MATQGNSQQTYQQMRGAILDDRAASFWLQDAIRALDARDPIDAVNDAEILFKLMEVRSSEIAGRWADMIQRGPIVATVCRGSRQRSGAR